MNVSTYRALTIFLCECRGLTREQAVAHADTVAPLEDLSPKIEELRVDVESFTGRPIPNFDAMTEREQIDAIGAALDEFEKPRAIGARGN